MKFNSSIYRKREPWGGSGKKAVKYHLKRREQKLKSKVLFLFFYFRVKFHPFLSFFEGEGGGGFVSPCFFFSTKQMWWPSGNESRENKKKKKHRQRVHERRICVMSFCVRLASLTRQVLEFGMKLSRA